MDQRNRRVLSVQISMLININHPSLGIHKPLQRLLLTHNKATPFHPQIRVILLKATASRRLLIILPHPILNHKTINGHNKAILRTKVTHSIRCTLMCRGTRLHSHRTTTQVMHLSLLMVTRISSIIPNPKAGLPKLSLRSTHRTLNISLITARLEILRRFQILMLHEPRLPHLLPCPNPLHR